MNLKSNNRYINIAPLQPQKIKPRVQLSDFRKYTPRTIKSSLLPNKPKAPPRLPPPKLPPRQQVPAVSAKIVVRDQPRNIIKPVKTNLSIINRPHQKKYEKVYRHNNTATKTIKVNRTNQQISKFKDIGKNKVLLIIAAGPSVNEVDFTPLLNNIKVDIMCINQPYTKVWPSTYWAFCDDTQRRRNIDIWDGYKGTIFNSTNVRASKPSQYVISNKTGNGFSLDILSGYHIGRSSTYANMQVAHYMGYEKVYIFGCDMTGVNGVMHYYGQNPDVPNERRQERFTAEAAHYLWAGQNLPLPIREKFIFCSSYNPWSFVELFGKRLDHKIAVDEILKVVNNQT